MFPAIHVSKLDLDIETQFRRGNIQAWLKQIPRRAVTWPVREEGQEIGGPSLSQAPRGDKQPKKCGLDDLFIAVPDRR